MGYNNHAGLHMISRRRLFALIVLAQDLPCPSVRELFYSLFDRKNRESRGKRPGIWLCSYQLNISTIEMP